jgi:hypothetical protein
LVVLVAVEMPQGAVHQVAEPSIQAEVVEVMAVLQRQRQAAQAVQALSFFATPAQFNISLVAQ